MPYKIVKNKGKKNSYKVINKDNNSVKAKDTTLKKAKAQIRLLHYIDSRKQSK